MTTSTRDSRSRSSNERKSRHCLTVTAWHTKSRLPMEPRSQLR
nr:MAG TPA: hypothetical protein [Caudoviricetes sp.]